MFSLLQRFDDFARETLRRASQSISLPPEASVYDYCVDSKTGGFVKWSDRQLERSRTTQNYQNIPEVSSRTTQNYQNIPEVCHSTSAHSLATWRISQLSHQHTDLYYFCVQINLSSTSPLSDNITSASEARRG